MKASDIISAVDSCLQDLQKQAAANGNVPADPTEAGVVQPEFAADGSPKVTAGVDGPAGTGKNAEGDLSGIKTGDANTPPATKAATDDTDPNPLSKQASALLAAVSDICGKLTKKASENAAAAPAAAPADAAPASEDAALSKSAEQISQELLDNPEAILKVASMVLSTERGRDMLQELAREQLGQEQAAAMLQQVDAEYDALCKHAAEQQSEEAQTEAFIRSILESDELSKTAKEHFVAGLHIHNEGMAQCLDAYEEALGGEALIKSASAEDQEKALACAQSITEAYIHGSQLAKQAAAMMAEQEIGPEELEALMVELEQYSPEEKIAAVQMLVEQGEIPAEIAEELIATFAAEAEGAAGPEAMPAEYAAGMGKAASVLAELAAESEAK